MASNTPVLSLISKPRQKGIQGGGKGKESIKNSRLAKQRQALSQQLNSIHKNAPTVAVTGYVTIVIKMFSDSLAPSYAPKDLFWSGYNANLIAPFKDGYLAEISVPALTEISELVKSTNKIKELVDISRIETIELLGATHVFGKRKPTEMFDRSLKAIVDKKKFGEFLIWLVPFTSKKLRTDSVKSIVDSIKVKGLLSRQTESSSEGEASTTELTDGHSIVNLPPLRKDVPAGPGARLFSPMYAVGIEDVEQLSALAASGKVIRIDPITPILSAEATAMGNPVGLTEKIDNHPIVAIVDGGRTAKSYDFAEAWKVTPELVDASIANTTHGNQVTSLVVNAHQLNSHLNIPDMFCRVGTVQAVTKNAYLHKAPGLKELGNHLDKAIKDNPETKVWNFSVNSSDECDFHGVSVIGHMIAGLARKHKILPIISAGNKEAHEDLRIAPPSDCEAGLVVAGRTHDSKGMVHMACAKSRIGLGPDEMLKPDMSWFSTVKVIGGNTVNGTSYAAPLVSRLAAHTWENLKNPSADLVKAILINNCDLRKYDSKLGWGSPISNPHPWECEPGTVCLAWNSKLKPGLEYYWDNIAIPSSMLSKNVLSGEISLTAILDPAYLNYAGVGNYFMTRIEVALQDAGVDEEDETANVLGSMKKLISELQARKLDHKWSPIRRHANNFRGRTLKAKSLRLRSRVFTRDLWQLGMQTNDVPELDVAFVLRFKSKDKDPETYNSFVQAMSQQVVSAVVDQNIEIIN